VLKLFSLVTKLAFHSNQRRWHRSFGFGILRLVFRLWF